MTVGEPQSLPEVVIRPSLLAPGEPIVPQTVERMDTSQLADAPLLNPDVDEFLEGMPVEEMDVEGAVGGVDLVGWVLSAGSSPVVDRMLLSTDEVTPFGDMRGRNGYSSGSQGCL